MRITMAHAQTARKRQNRSARRAEQHHITAAWFAQVLGVCTTEDAGRGEKHLSGRADLGETQIYWSAAWGMSAKTYQR